MIAPWCRRRVIVIEEFSGFPTCVAQIIAEYCATPQLLPWIDQSCLDWHALCENPRAIESGMIDVRYADIDYLASNPAAAEFIKVNIDKIYHSWGIWGNPALFDWLIGKYPNTNSYDWDSIAENSNPNAIRCIIDRYGNNAIEHVSLCNPSITLFWSWEDIFKRTHKKQHKRIHGNPSAIDLIKDKFDECNGNWISCNSHPLAIEYLRTHQDKINWWDISKNPGIFECRADPNLIKLLSE